MPERINARFFAFFGVILGILYGLIFSVWNPPRTAIITDLYDPVMWAIAILSFFILQFGFAVILRRPNATREIYFGMFLIPMIYTASVATTSIPDFLRTLMAVEVPVLVLFLASFYFVSPFVVFFAGLDTEALDDAEIPSETLFSFDIQHSMGGLKLLRRIVNGLGFTILRKNIKDENGLIICRKEKLHMGIFHESKDQVLRATFVPFTIANDKVKEVKDVDTILDFKAQISGMLYAWLQNKLVLRFNETLPNVELGLKNVSKGLGPLEKSLPVYLRDSIVSFPKNHPYRLALLTTGFVIIINIMLFILGKLVFK